jgi:hypothetical protein
MSEAPHGKFTSPHRIRFLGATCLKISIAAIILGLAAALTRFGVLVPIALVVAFAGIAFGHWAGLRRSGKALIGALLSYAVAAGMVFGVMVPNFVNVRNNSVTFECARNLRAIDEAKQLWAVKFRKGNRETPTPKDLEPFLKDGKFPACPGGGTYNIRSITETPKCSVAAHNSKPD